MMDGEDSSKEETKDGEINQHPMMAGGNQIMMVGETTKEAIMDGEDSNNPMTVGEEIKAIKACKEVHNSVIKEQ
jgi:hypothetical protein